MAKKSEERVIRKLYKHSRSYALTIPIELIRELKWQKKQKLFIKKEGKGILITDWE